MPNDELLVETLECQNDTKIGHITLNSPETLNSLTLNMVNQISNLLDKWEADPKIKMIIISGSGDKAFCAGGDIRALYESMCSADGPIFAETFFESEYRLDYKLHNFPKPIISIIDGIVMGGGAGLMFGSSFKISTERTKFAMPEIGVGLFPDVGFTSVIKDLPEGLGLYIMLTSTQLNAADTLFCNLTDCSLSSEDLEKFFREVQETEWKDKKKDNLKILNAIVQQDGYIKKLQISVLQANFIEFLIKFKKFKSCLEIGTFTGYSALSIALSLPKNGRLYCIDKNEEKLNIAKKFFKQARVNKKIFTDILTIFPNRF